MQGVSAMRRFVILAALALLAAALIGPSGAQAAVKYPPKCKQGFKRSYLRSHGKILRYKHGKLRGKPRYVCKKLTPVTPPAPKPQEVTPPAPVPPVVVPPAPVDPGPTPTPTPTPVPPPPPPPPPPV